jgi:hypothetical protein
MNGDLLGGLQGPDADACADASSKDVPAENGHAPSPPSDFGAFDLLSGSPRNMQRKEADAEVPPDATNNLPDFAKPEDHDGDNQKQASVNLLDFGGGSPPQHHHHQQHDDGNSATNPRISISAEPPNLAAPLSGSDDSKTTTPMEEDNSAAAAAAAAPTVDPKSFEEEEGQAAPEAVGETVTLSAGPTLEPQPEQPVPTDTLQTNSTGLVTNKDTAVPAEQEQQQQQLGQEEVPTTSEETTSSLPVVVQAEVESNTAEQPSNGVEHQWASDESSANQRPTETQKTNVTVSSKPLPGEEDSISPETSSSAQRNQNGSSSDEAKPISGEEKMSTSVPPPQAEREKSEANDSPNSAQPSGSAEGQNEKVTRETGDSKCDVNVINETQNPTSADTASTWWNKEDRGTEQTQNQSDSDSKDETGYTAECPTPVVASLPLAQPAKAVRSSPPSTPPRPVSSDEASQKTPNPASQKSSLPAPLTPNPSQAPQNAPGTPLPDRLKWLEQELHAAHSLIQQLQHREEEEEKTGNAIMVELQASLQSQLSQRAEAEDAARRATAEAKKSNEQLEKLQNDAEGIIGELTKDLTKVSKEKTDMQTEFEQIREERDEQARKESALTNRLNAAKKNEAVKANAAEHYEDLVDNLEKQGQECKEKLTKTTAERDQLKNEVAQWKQYAEQRTKQLESALNDEKKLNDERKRKMKEFVEAKTEEVRSAKADNISLQTELDQTNRSLKELNQRYKQLHAQWVQAQTRNRELQRDMTKMKKDSEKMTKVGGSLEAKLSRSANEADLHKNKRLAAKHELMAVLHQLEAERETNNRLRESIKVTFTPKALSQQQTVQETLDDFEGALIKLATKLGRQLPPPPVTGNDLLMEMMTEQTLDDGTPSEDNEDSGDAESDKPSVPDANTTKVLTKLENETQRLSQCIMAVTSSVERLHTLVEGPNHRSCVGALQHFLLSSSAQTSEETASITGTRRTTTRGSRYGQVPGGTLT